MTKTGLDGLVGRLSLGPGHKLQEVAVASALSRLLLAGQRGVVLADEVGFGKTYEALAIMALLADHARSEGRSFERVLVLAKHSLLPKWADEVSFARSDEGFPQYLVGNYWEHHPIRSLLMKSVHIIDSRWRADDLRADGLRGERLDGAIQAPRGFYIVNERLLDPEKRGEHILLGQIYRTRWDLIIVDEAHHYARGNRSALLFAPDRDWRNYAQGIGEGQFGSILTLTATPFELEPRELLNLLRLIHADPGDCGHLEIALANYEQQLNRFFNVRRRSPHDELRATIVEQLRRLRTVDALGNGSLGAGLEGLMRRYIIRNTKIRNERKYFVVNKCRSEFGTLPFEKLDDLEALVRNSNLIPFEGLDALFYLELRELIQETLDAAREGIGHRTFISADLRQGLSSYPQILASSLLRREDLKGSERLRRLLQQWKSGATRRLHPKVLALCDVVRRLALDEIEKVRRDPQQHWFGKILVFNKMIEGTAGQLKQETEGVLAPLFEGFLIECIQLAGIGDGEKWKTDVRKEMARQLDDLRRELTARFGSFCRLPQEFQDPHFKHHRDRHIVDLFNERLLRRAQQPMFLIRALTHGNAINSADIGEWIRTETIQPLGRELTTIIDSYLDDSPTLDVTRDELLVRAERELVKVIEEVSPIDLVGRFDGENVKSREAHRRNFNEPYNPFLLLVSRVGEEGIDLQRHCRYVLHYDLEWNPAKMEQREGRVDRDKWNQEMHKFIDVRFFLLKGTYEERIFHTVMQRDQWFQILIGSKKRELGNMPSDETNDGTAASDLADEAEDTNPGRLTEEEKEAVMLDLRPTAGIEC